MCALRIIAEKGTSQSSDSIFGEGPSTSTTFESTEDSRGKTFDVASVRKKSTMSSSVTSTSQEQRKTIASLAECDGGAPAMIHFKLL